MTDELRKFVREAVGHAYEGAPPPGQARGPEPTFGGGSEGVDVLGGWRPTADPDDEVEVAGAGDVDDAGPVWASEGDEDAAAAGDEVWAAMSPEDQAAVDAGDLDLWEQRFRERFPDWDGEAEAGDDEDAAEALGKPMNPAREFVESLLAEPDFKYPDGEPVAIDELLRWMITAPEGEFDEWASQVGWDGPQPGLDDLPGAMVMEITASKLDERLAAIEAAKESGTRPPYI